MLFTPANSFKYPRGYSTWIAWPWRWRHYNASKCLEQFPQRHNVTCSEDLILQPLNILSLLFVIFSIHPKINLSSPLPVLSMQGLGFLQDQFQPFSISRYFSPASNTNFLQIIFSIVQLSLPCFFRGKFLPEILLNTFFTILAPWANKYEKLTYQLLSAIMM